MRRPITQIGQSILEWLFTRPAQDNMVALAKLSSAVLGTSTQFSGLAVGPTSPASLQVSVAPGEIYMLTALEGTAYGTLPADTTHQIVKQGINLDAVLLTIAAPSVAGQSINYLIQATFQETDISVDPTSGASPVVLPFYNDSNPTQPYSGPNNTGQTSNTFRQGSVVLNAKAGISATTGSQVTPSPDSGYVGIAVVTIANGQTTITSGNISAYSGAPSINSTLHGNSPVFGVPVQIGAAVSSSQAAQLGQVLGNQQKITSSSSFTVPVGVTTLYISGVAGGGGGGAGGGSVITTNISSGGAGGGAGQSVQKQPYAVTPSSTISITIGSGGAAGVAASGANGGAGGNGGSTVISGMTAGTVTLFGGNGGGGGTSASTTQVGGSTGGAGYPRGGAGSDSSQNNASGNGGSGASCAFGGGGGSGRGATSAGAPSLSNHGSDAFGYGSGGGGGGGYYTGTTTQPGGSGGAGAPGWVLIEW
ncbi:hypothetical protein [Herbaspirillum frisingense]|uniref:glycine-rich domain-containing protein n=1 Tax=Herbaspirillum frisingense TaxID=92645 RepID=UPI0039AFD389